ncbi:MAG: hypothetical protein JOZ62_01770, partial [Acidobacteriaceae bacterium]|nr:hypothetical protein [Acidobacteriaceae bacterium]
MRTAGYVATSLLAVSALVNAQSQTPSRGWPSVSDSPYQNEASTQPPANYDSNPNASQGDMDQPPPPPPGSNQAGGQYGSPPYGMRPYGQPGAPPNGPAPSTVQQAIPSQLTIPAGTYVTVRINQVLSSDRNQKGDAFTATLAQPLVVNGIVVAEPGQTVAGQVTEAQKAGHIEGVARLGVQLTELTLVDGQQVPIRTQFISRSGPTSVGRDAAAIGGTTALGAAIGAAADWGRGAAIGAGAGAAVGILGVLVTRG